MSTSQAEGCWTFDTRDRMDRHALLPSSLKNADRNVRFLSHESGFVRTRTRRAARQGELFNGVATGGRTRDHADCGGSRQGAGGWKLNGKGNTCGEAQEPQRDTAGFTRGVVGGNLGD